MLKDEFCTTQGSACIIFMGADFWAARIYEWWGMGNAKTGCGASNLRNSASNKRGAASLLLPPPIGRFYKLVSKEGRFSI